MLVIQIGENVWGANEGDSEFTQLPLTYIEFPTKPSPESLNMSMLWLQDFFKAESLPYVASLHVVASGSPVAYGEIVYGDAMYGTTIKKSIALYTIANAISMGTEQSLKATLRQEFKYV